MFFQRRKPASNTFSLAAGRSSSKNVRVSPLSQSSNAQRRHSTNTTSRTTTTNTPQRPSALKKVDARAPLAMDSASSDKFLRGGSDHGNPLHSPKGNVIFPAELSKPVLLPRGSDISLTRWFTNTMHRPSLETEHSLHFGLRMPNTSFCLQKLGYQRAICVVFSAFLMAVAWVGVGLGFILVGIAGW